MANKLDKDVIALDILRQEKDELEVKINALNERVLTQLEEVEGAYTVEHDGRKVSVVRVQAQGRTIINEVGLKKSLGKDWAKVTSQVLDKKKLEAFIASGEIDATVVAQNSSVGEPSKPYVKVTVK